MASGRFFKDTKIFFYYFPAFKKNLNYISVINDESNVSNVETIIEKAAFNGDIVSIVAIDSYRILYFDAYIEKVDSSRREVHFIKSNLDVKVLSFKNILHIKVKNF